MRKRKDFQLDEMQQEKLLKINSNGLNICYWGLLAAIVIQWLTERDITSVIGEIIIYVILMIYTVCAYIYEGLWSAKSKPSVKRIFLISLIPPAAVGILLCVKNIMADNRLYELSVILFAMAIAFAVCVTILYVLLCLYRRRRRSLDGQE